MQNIKDCKRINSKGYIEVLANGKYVLEHVKVVEKFIGRKLKKGEIIHHIDENKQNNKIENLMLFKNQKEHASFHNKIKQFGFTYPVLRMIKNRWDSKNVQDILKYTNMSRCIIKTN